MQRLVDIAALLQSLALNLSLFCSLAARKVNNVYLRPSGLGDVILFYFRLDIESENCMGTRALVVHGSGGSLPVLDSPHENAHSILIISGILLRQPLDVDSLLEIFSDLPELEVRVKLRSMKVVPGR